VNWVKADIVQTFEIDRSNQKFEPVVKVLLEYVDELINSVNKLEPIQSQIQNCDDFLLKHAARKKAYHSTRDLEDKIAVLKKEKPENW